MKTSNRIISETSDQKMTKRSSLESPYRDESNGGLHISLASIDNELSSKNQKQKNANNFPLKDAKDMNQPPFDASQRDESNKLRFIFLRPIDGETPQNI